MASVAESLFVDDARSRRKKKKRNSSKQIEAVTSSGHGTNDEVGDVDNAWQQFTSPDGRPYYYNQATQESRWKLPRALRHKQEAAAATGREKTTANSAVASEETVEPLSQPKKEKRPSVEKPAGGASGGGRGDIVARLQASLAGRINPMASGPPAMIKIPRGVPDASDSTERSRANLSGPDTNGDGIFSASGVFGTENPETQYDAETAGMTPAERLRFIRRKRQESMFRKEKIVEEDDFMKEFTRNMKKKEEERVQRMTPEELEREKLELERKKRETEAKKRKDEEAARKKREEEEEAERERQRQLDEEQRQWQEAERKVKEEKEREQQEREAAERAREEKEKRRREKEENRRKKEDQERDQQRQEEEEREHARQRRRSTNSNAAVDDTVDADAVPEPESKARRRTRSTGSKTFAGEAVAYTESHRSRSSSYRSVKESEEHPIAVTTTPATSATDSPQSGDACSPIEIVTKSLETTQLESEETEEERAARKERRRQKKERRRREEVGEEVGPAENEAPPQSAPPSMASTPPPCQCAACLQANAGHPPHHQSPPSSYHQPPGSHGSYPYYPPHYPPPPYYPPPPMYGYGMPPPPPFMPMYASPPPMMLPPGMMPMSMLMAPPPSGGIMMNGLPGSMDGTTNGAIIVAPEYAQYAPPVMSQCEGCRGRGVGLAEKNGFCAHCNRLRLDFIVVSAQIRKRCTSCGGWGLGLVQSNGMCAHCTRLATQKATADTGKTTDPGDWDASSSDDNSEWDD